VTCVETMTFRLLDDRVGWDPLPAGGLDGVVISGGALTLGPTHGPTAPDRVGPPTLAWMCEGCSWWLGTRHGILRRGPCDDLFTRWADTGPVRALAARGSRLAALVDGLGVLVFDAPSGHLTGSFASARGTAISLTPWGAILVGDADGVLHEVDLSGMPCSALDTGSPISAVAHEPEHPCRALVIHPSGAVTVAAAGVLTAGDPSLLEGLATNPVSAATPLGFCVRGSCFDWDGAPLDPTGLGPGPARYPPRGQYLSAPLDSGLPRCRWHRLRIDAEIPAGTTVEVAIATTDGPPQGRVAQLAAASPWNTFPAGDPHPDDWFEVSSGVVDVTLSLPPGRHAYVRVRLTGDGSATPKVHQIRVDLPRRTSLDDLPAVYAGDVDARDFSERFVTLFDAQLEEVDETVERLPALLDAAALPDDALTWLAGLLGLGFEAVMTVAQRRALIAAAPDLYRRRGTPSGLVRTLAVALGITAIVEELGSQRPWGAAGDARLGTLRLFGRSRARVRLGTSQLGRAPLMSSGNPDDDARLAGANRIVVSVPPNSDRGLVERVVRSQTPAHVVASVQMRAPGFVLTDLRLGIDTVIAGPAPAVLGTVRLGRLGVLRPGRAGKCLAVVGRPLIVGSTTRLE
jgi:phage tail-like protein